MTKALTELAAPGGWEALFEPEGWPVLAPALLGYMRLRRWFSGKARQVGTAQIQAMLPLEYAGRPAYLALVRVAYADGGAETYVLPLAHAAAARLPELPPHALVARVGTGTLFDPIYDAAFCGALLDLIASRARIVAGAGELLAETTREFARLRGPAGDRLMPKVSTAEQSNSSIIFGERLIMKLFRRIEPGLNPDIEIGRFLTEHSPFAHIPPLAGTLEYRRGGEHMSMALLQGLVPNRGDAWYYTLDTIAATFQRLLALPGGLREPPAAGRALLDDTSQALPAEAAALLGEYRGAAELLGQRTGELHLALASATGLADFALEPFTPAYQAAVYRSMEARARESFGLLRAGVGGLPAALRPAAQQVLDAEPRVFALLQAALARPIGAQRMRIHGDYHLGQVLYTGGDFFIIDFEGEPARPLSERRLKSSALQDVAGMLRSFHYAPYAVLFGQAPGVSFGAEAAAALARWAHAWQHWACVAFLRSYLAVVGHAPFLPGARAELQPLLEAYLLDKAVYELRYELNNRPAWAGIPIEGVLGLL